jgi:hypothetical protein
MRSAHGKRACVRPSSFIRTVRKLSPVSNRRLRISTGSADPRLHLQRSWPRRSRARCQTAFVKAAFQPTAGGEFRPALKTLCFLPASRPAQFSIAVARQAGGAVLWRERCDRARRDRRRTPPLRSGGDYQAWAEDETGRRRSRQSLPICRCSIMCSFQRWAMSSSDGRCSSGRALSPSSTGAM